MSDIPFALWTLVIALVGLTVLWCQPHRSWLCNALSKLQQTLWLPSESAGKANLSIPTRQCPEKHATLPPGNSSASPSPRLTILVAGDTFSPDVNGAAIFTLQLAAGLAHLGHKLHVIVPSINGIPGVFEENHGGAKIIIHRLRSVRWTFLTSLRCAVPWEVRTDVSLIMNLVKPDIVHIQSFFQIGRGVAREAYVRNIPIVATNHFLPENANDCTWFGKGIIWLGLNFLLADAARTYHLVDTITAPTKKAAMNLERTMHLGGNSVKSISCGIHIRDCTAKPGRPRLNEIIFVGRLAPEKQLNILLLAFHLLPPELDARLRIVGNGVMLANLQTLARQLEIAERVTFAGHVSEVQKYDALTNATLFVMPSTAELQSLSCLEAMASGLPLVVADAMALPHLINGNGYLFEPGNEIDLAKKLTDILAVSEQEYIRMSSLSRAMVHDHDIHKTLQAYEAIYYTLFQDRGLQREIEDTRKLLHS